MIPFSTILSACMSGYTYLLYVAFYRHCSGHLQTRTISEHPCTYTQVPSKSFLQIQKRVNHRYSKMRTWHFAGAKKMRRNIFFGWSNPSYKKHMQFTMVYASRVIITVLGYVHKADIPHFEGSVIAFLC